MKFDDLLKHGGEFGTYQRRLFFLVGTPVIFVAFPKFAWVFLGAIPQHRCLTAFEDPLNTTYHLPSHVLNESIPWDGDYDRWDRCQLWDEYPNTKSCDQWVYDRTEYSSSVITDFNLVCGWSWMGPLVQTIYVSGELIGSTVCGVLADRLGRRKVIVLLIVLEGLSGVLAGLFKNYWSFLVFRVIVGLAAQGLILICVVLVMEFVGPMHRILVGVAVNYFFAMGYIIVAALAYWIRNWQYLQIALSVPIILFFITFRWMPESARWLLSKNRPEEALKIIRKLFETNEKELPKEILADFDIQSQSVVPQASTLDLFRNNILRNRISIMTYSWFVNSAVYYGLSLNTSNLGGNVYLNFLIAALMEFPAYTICIFVLKYGGRKIPLCTSMCIAGVALICTGIVPKEMTVMTITLAMIGKFGITVSYSIVYVFAVELYPTQVRNAGMGINSAAARLGAMTAPFFVFLADYWLPLPLILLGILGITAGFLSFCLPETQGKALEETVQRQSDMEIELTNEKA